MKVALIGLGNMGLPMAANLLKAGHQVIGFDLSETALAAHRANGGETAATIAQAVADVDAVVTMLPTGKHVADVCTGQGGILASISPRTKLVIDSSTIDVATAKQVGADAAEKGVEFLDAPVSGGDRGAREATLTVMTGGAEEHHRAAEPLLAHMGRTIERLGDPGAGQLCKLANQIAVASGMVAMTETLAFAKAVGLDLAAVHRAVSGGAAGSWPMTNLAPRVLRGDFAPGFYAKHLVKDLGLALDTAREAGVELPGLELAARLYDRVVAAGDGDLGTQALARRYFALA